MKILRKISLLFFPPRCALCDEVVAFPDRQSDDKRFYFDKCGFRCLCAKCRDKKKLYLYISESLDPIECVSFFRYDGDAKKSMLKLKMHGDKNKALQLARLLTATVCEVYPDYNFDMVTFVPMDAKKKKERGFNQTELLAKFLADFMQIDVKNVLQKRDNVLAQHTLSMQDRKKNVKDAFSIMADADVKDKNILLIDDIVTTGSTLISCCKVLRDAGAQRVVCATVCKSMLDQKAF